MKNRLQSNRFIAAYPGPLLVVHGSEDKLILPYHGRELFELSPAADKEFFLAEGVDHNRLFFDDGNHRTMLDWLNRRFGAGRRRLDFSPLNTRLESFVILAEPECPHLSACADV